MHFLTKKRTPDGKYYVSSIAALKPGFEFLIQCDDEASANQVIADIAAGTLSYPSVDPTGFTDISRQFPALEGVPRIYRRT